MTQTFDKSTRREAPLRADEVTDGVDTRFARPAVFVDHYMSAINFHAGAVDRCDTRHALSVPRRRIVVVAQQGRLVGAAQRELAG